MNKEQLIKEAMKNLHCGACGTKFDNLDDLNRHIENCPVAKIILIQVNYFIHGGSDFAHKLAHFVMAVHKNVHLVKQYAMAVATDVDSITRAKIHAELCKRLGLEYHEFRPFESETITKMLSIEEAEKILWDALYEEAKALMIEQITTYGELTKNLRKDEI